MASYKIIAQEKNCDFKLSSTPYLSDSMIFEVTPPENWEITFNEGQMILFESPDKKASLQIASYADSKDFNEKKAFEHLINLYTTPGPITFQGKTRLGKLVSESSIDIPNLGSGKIINIYQKNFGKERNVFYAVFKGKLGFYDIAGNIADNLWDCYQPIIFESMKTLQEYK
jgi:hypothetical protein